MSFYGNGFEIIGVNKMVGTFPQEIKAVLLQLTDKITPFDGHR